MSFTGSSSIASFAGSSDDFSDARMRFSFSSFSSTTARTLSPTAYSARTSSTSLSSQSSFSTMAVADESSNWITTPQSFTFFTIASDVMPGFALWYVTTMRPASADFYTSSLTLTPTRSEMQQSLSSSCSDSTRAATNCPFLYSAVTSSTKPSAASHSLQ